MYQAGEFQRMKMMVDAGANVALVDKVMILLALCQKQFVILLVTGWCNPASSCRVHGA